MFGYGIKKVNKCLIISYSYKNFEKNTKNIENSKN